MSIPKSLIQHIGRASPQAWTLRNKRSHIVGVHVCLTVYLLLFATTLPAQTPSKVTALDPLHQFNNSVEALVKRVSPSVVQVLATGYGAVEESSRNNMGLAVEKQRSTGSGVIVDPNGYIVTNAHVVAGAQRVQVIVPTLTADQSPLRSLVSARGEIVEAQIIGTDRELDLALLKVNRVDLPPLPLAHYKNLRQGELVFSFGSPAGLSNSVTSGVVSSTARQLDPDSFMVYVQTDAPINPGNSGGPLVNVDGEIVGINTFILTESGGNQGLGFAIPSSVVNVAYQQFRKYGHLHHSGIGMAAQAINPNLAAGLGLPRNFGLVVSDVLPGGPGDAAGLKVQDIILAINDKQVDSLPLLAFDLFTHVGGEQIKVRVLRGSQELLLDVSVVERPHELDRLADLVKPANNLVEKLGILGMDLNGQIAQLLPDVRLSSGVIVLARAADSRGGHPSLVAGDVIHAMNGTSIDSLNRLRSGLDQLKPRSPVVLQIERDGKLMFVDFQLD
ncbi:MAG TPA: trypsin-like peptidase domain-containing protein [Candidatus Dormibacteraeota bacterium]|nr:trypsin-like peptidase domain-containing protein [Candidatus Dormibacteraeota bacterium]